MTTQPREETTTATVYEYTCDICGNKVDYLDRCHICGRDMCNECSADCSHEGWEGYVNDERTEGFCKECAVIGMDCIHAMAANDIYYEKYVEYCIGEWKQAVREATKE